MVKRSLILAIGALGVALASAEANASLIRSMALGEIVAESDQIVVADVLSVRSVWDARHRAIHATIDVGIRERWKGTVPNDGRIAIRQLGGVVGDIEMTVHGMPKFAVGERAVLFLRKSRVVGMSQGKRSLRWESSANRWLVERTSDESLVTLDGRGQILPVPRESAQPLDELRTRVLDLIRR